MQNHNQVEISTIPWYTAFGVGCYISLASVSLGKQNIANIFDDPVNYFHIIVFPFTSSVYFAPSIRQHRVSTLAGIFAGGYLSKYIPANTIEDHGICPFEKDTCSVDDMSAFKL